MREVLARSNSNFDRCSVQQKRNFPLQDKKGDREGDGSKSESNAAMHHCIFYKQYTMLLRSLCAPFYHSRDTISRVENMRYLSFLCSSDQREKAGTSTSADMLIKPCSRQLVFLASPPDKYLQLDRSLNVMPKWHATANLDARLHDARSKKLRDKHRLNTFI